MPILWIRNEDDTDWYQVLLEGTTLDDLSDVTAGSPSAGDVLTYDGSMWISGSYSGSSGGPGAANLDDLLDVDTIGKEDGDTIGWSSGSSAWVHQTPLKYTGLTKITVSSGSPSAPATGDLWINSA